MPLRNSDSPQCDTVPQTAPPCAALWTPQGRGAVATIKVQADLSSTEGSIPFRAANQRRFYAQDRGRVVFGHWGTDPSEEVVICRLSEHEFEIHCHGGQAAARRILADLETLQISIVGWGDQMRQSAGNLNTDCQLALTKATTLQTASILLDQEAAWRNLGEQIITAAVAGLWSELKTQINHALSWQDLGRHLLEPFRVVLTGEPNVGKSALLNALVGYQRSVVFDQPGTTRDVVTVETAFDGWPVRLIDTAGLRDNALGLEAAGIELAHAQVAEADLVLHVRDATRPVAWTETPPQVSSQKSILVINKSDLLPAKASPDSSHHGAIQVSARTGFGVESLIAEIAAKLVPVRPASGTLIPFHEDQVRWLHDLADAIERQSLQEVREISYRILS